MNLLIYVALYDNQRTCKELLISSLKCINPLKFDKPILRTISRSVL